MSNSGRCKSKNFNRNIFMKQPDIYDKRLTDFKHDNNCRVCGNRIELGLFYCSSKCAREAMMPNTQRLLKNKQLPEELKQLIKKAI